MFPLIKLAKKLKELLTPEQVEELEKFPLIKLAKKLKAEVRKGMIWSNSLSFH